jgi:hypothetical protein
VECKPIAIAIDGDGIAKGLARRRRFIAGIDSLTRLSGATSCVPSGFLSVEGFIQPDDLLAFTMKVARGALLTMKVARSARLSLPLPLGEGRGEGNGHGEQRLSSSGVALVAMAVSQHGTFRLAGQEPYHWPMDAPDLLPRHAARLLVEALADSPVVLIHGPRQCGKTTLARMVADRS